MFDFSWTMAITVPVARSNWKIGMSRREVALAGRSRLVVSRSRRVTTHFSRSAEGSPVAGLTRPGSWATPKLYFTSSAQTKSSPSVFEES